LSKKLNRRSSPHSCAVIIVEHPTEALSPLAWTLQLGGRSRPQQLVCETLMIALSMVVRHEVADRVVKRDLYEEDPSIQTLGLYCAHEAFGERIQIG
jgi:hypothetical protein